MRAQAWHRAEELRNKPRIQSFDLDAIRAAPAHLQPFAQEILPILTFLNSQLLPENRRLKAPNLLLWSTAPNTGKSSLFQLIETLTATYRWPTDNWYQN